MTRYRAAVLTLLLCPAAAAAQPTQGGDLGVPLPLFPADNWWNVDVSGAPLDPKSGAFLNFIGVNRQVHPDFGGYADSPPGEDIYGFPYVVVNGDTQPKREVTFLYDDESDGVGEAFYPIPDEAITELYWIEGGPPGDDPVGGDRHMLIVDRDNNDLYELFDLFWDGSQWTAGSGAFFDMDTNDRRPEGWTSADAAGLAILPGLIRRDEVIGPDPIRHAFRVTVRATNGHVFPASHTAGSTTGALPMGARLRLKANKDISGYPPEIQRIFQAMKTYGLIVADNGSDMYVSGTFDPNWDNDVLNPAFHSLRASDFEVVKLGWKPPTGQLSVAGPSVVAEGDAGRTAVVFTVSLDEVATEVVSVSYATAPGTATAADFVGRRGSLVFAPGVTDRTVSVLVKGDRLDEDDETFSLVLSNPRNALLGTDTAVATIQDDDPEPALLLGDRAVLEGDAGASAALLPLTLSAPSGRTVTVDYVTADDTAVAGSDYVPVAGTATIPPGKTKGAVAVPILGDVVQEPDETFLVTLSNPGNATLVDTLATGAITDDDDDPSFTIGDVTLLEGNAGNTMALFAVNLSSNSPDTITVRYSTLAGTAKPRVDFQPRTGVLTFPPGVTNQPINVPVVGDTLDETNEVFLVRLANPVGAKILRGTAQGVIQDDEGTPDPCTPVLALPITLSAPGEYCLARPASTPIRAGAAVAIAADGVTLDLKNFGLTNSGGVATQAIGIHADQRTDVTVRNGTVRGFFAGMRLVQPAPFASPGGLVVENVKALNNRYAGIWVEGQGNVLTGNTVTATGKTPVLGPVSSAWGLVSHGQGALVSGNVVKATTGTGGGSTYGITVAAGDASTISDNAVTGAGKGSTGILVDGSAGVPVNDNALVNLTFGIVFTNGATGTTSGNSFTRVDTPQIGP